MSTADTTEDTKPTEEEVQEANENEEQKWEGDFKEEDLTVPYKNEEEPKTDEEEDKESEVEEEPAEEYEDPEPVVTTEDPGEYKPADYSFEVKLADGKTKTIRTPEEADKIAEDPDNFETPAQLLDFIRKAQKMENKLDKDKEKWEAEKQKHDEQVQTEKERTETINSYTAEFEYLAEKGLIPKLSQAKRVADWQDPKYADDKDIKVYNDILDYLIEENKVRAKANVRPLTSIVDAFNAWQLDTNRQKQEKETKAAGEARKAAGARVAGSSPAQQGAYVPKGIAVGDPNVMKRGAANWDN